MNVIAVVAQKGGVGKTTVSQCLAVEALRQGIAAAIIDTDPQKSAAEWGSSASRSSRRTRRAATRIASAEDAGGSSCKNRGAQLDGDRYATALRPGDQRGAGGLYRRRHGDDGPTRWSARPGGDMGHREPDEEARRHRIHPDPAG